MTPQIAENVSRNGEIAEYLGAAKALELEAQERLRPKHRDSQPGATKPEARAAEASALATLALSNRLAAFTLAEHS